MYFFSLISLTLPLLFSGLVLIFVIKKGLLTFLNYPLDFNLRIYGQRLFGQNKTFRGPAVFLLISITTCIALNLLLVSYQYLYIHNIYYNKPIFLGTIFASAYTLGELLNSLIKRQYHIPPGKTSSNYQALQYLADTIDGILITVLVLFLFTDITFNETILALIIGSTLHLLTDKIMFYLSLK